MIPPMIPSGPEEMTGVTEPQTAPPQASVALRALTYCLLMPLIALSTTFFGCISLVCGLWDTSGRQQHAIARVWAQSLLYLSLSPVKIVGLERLNLAQPAVYASNHLSYYDTPVLFAKLPFQFRILAKQGLWKIPFIGWYLNRSGQVPVDSSSTRSAIASLNRGVSTLKSGMPLVLFPEGGRTETGDLQPFMSGCAFMAIKAQVPLVPIALIGTYELLPIHTYHLTPRPLMAILGEPIPTVGMTTRDADALTQRLYDTIGAMYHHYATPARF
jgi:1-acyl-sn-glycerol-3-phosphate acyltransferase